MVELATSLSSMGFSHVPVVPSTKKPTVEWRTYQERRPSKEECHIFYRSATAIALICGAVSGNLLCIDFDEPGACDAFEIESEGYGLWNVVQRMVRTQTPSYGNHLWLRCTGETPRNEKLARDKDRQVISETRGEGGYAIIPPSPGYVLQRGCFESVPVLHSADVHALLALAGTFDQTPVVEEYRPKPSMNINYNSEDSPVKWYNTLDHYYDALLRAGWKVAFRRGNEWFWTRPGKSDGVSATSNYKGTNRFHIFSSNALPFESGRSYSPYAVYAMLAHGGDFRAAVRELDKVKNRGL